MSLTSIIFISALQLAILNFEAGIISLDSKKSEEDSFKALSSKRTRLIHDITIPWNETMHRPWLVSKEDDDKLPSMMILLTNYGWNHPNQSLGLTFARTIRERELYSGLVNHPLFHPTAWEDIDNEILPIRNNTNYYVFLDRMSCTEENYPIYGGRLKKNRDYEFGRAPYEFGRAPGLSGLNNGIVKCSPSGGRDEELDELDLKATRLFQANKDKMLNINVTLMLFNCRGFGNCQNQKDPGLSTSIAYLSGNLQEIDEDIDQGLIPPPVRRPVLTLEEEASIRSCQAETERNFEVAYMGNFRSGKNDEWHKTHVGARKAYKKYHNSKQIIIQGKKEKKPMCNGTKYTLSYTDVLRRTKFALSPRGDNKFSYRFTEILSAGAIPVYHGDNYVLPFRPELFDWDKCAILLPEKYAGDVAMEYIQNKLLPDPDTMCAMRNYCYFEIYKKYIETNERIIYGLVKGLDLVAKGHSANFQGTKCNHTVDLDCNNFRRH